MSFVPIPCPPGGVGSGGSDVEQNILCDVMPDGEIVGTALAVYEYDSEGNPVGAPTFVDPATGDPYVAQGVLQPCPGDVGCLAPVQFCFTSTSTGPVDHPGRQYDITLPINPGFPVQSLQVDAINHAANIVWDVADPDGEQFRQDLTAFIEARVPADAVVTITNPNAGNVICGTAQPMQIHIECLRLDQNPPNLIELVYNGGEDLILNPAYNETPPLNPPVSQGNYGFHLLSRQDDPGPFPINQPANDANCTNVVNRGWETNDIGRTFEIWGQDQVLGQGVTPTPRGTPVQEMTSDGAPPGGRSTIWQTFMAPASANFIVRVVHGARDPGENHIIALDFGDTDDAQNGDLINDNTNPPGVTSASGSNPWTTFSQTLPLTAGQVYTLSLSSTNPVAPNRGGLFTDMRAYIDRPDLRATATTDDDTCVVTVDETTTNTDCQLWQPRCINGEIVSWRNVETQAELANAAFWGQAPAPDCCLPQAAEGEDGGSVAANLVHNYEICGIVGGVPTTLNRIVITDASGGVLLDQIIGADGAPVAPSSYTIGKCDSSNRYVNDEILCDDNGPFLRKYVQNFNGNGQVQVQTFRDFDLAGTLYTPVGTVGNCDLHIQDVVLCDGGNDGHSFLRKFVQEYDYGTDAPTTINFTDFELDGTTIYVPVGPVIDCSRWPDPPAFDTETQVLCDDNGPFLRTYRYDEANGIFIAVGDQTLAGAGYAAVGTVGICSPHDPVREVEQQLMCDNGTTPFIRHTVYLDGLIDNQFDTDLDTSPYVPVGPVTPGPCAQVITINQEDIEIVTLCDDNGGFLRRFNYDAETGLPVSVITTDFAGNPYVPVGTIRVCDVNQTVTSIDSEIKILCDSNGTQFLRHYTYNEQTGAFIATADTNLAGGAFAPVGAVSECPTTGEFDIEYECFQDNNGTRFFRAYVFTDDSGVPTATADFTPAGAPFVPVGNVVPCDSLIQQDAEQEILCDSEGTRFLRKYSWSQNNGNIAASFTTDWELDGVTPFVPVGAVGPCEDCCPIVVANVCLSNGHAGVVIRQPDGTLTYTDTVTNTAFNPATDIVTCPAPAEAVATVTVQGRLLAASQSWTPGTDVTGTLTGVGFTVLTGTVNLVDQNGTASNGLPAGLTVSWNAEDQDTLSPPQSITTAAASTAFIFWTQR